MRRIGSLPWLSLGLALCTGVACAEGTGGERAAGEEGSAENAAVTAAGADTLRFRGEARDVESSSLMYVEDHLLRSEDAHPVERLVLYRCPGGEAFARKHVRYGEPPFAPQFEILDARFDYREGFNRGKLAGETFVQRGADEAMKKEAVALGESLVVDAGFDEFVRAHWGTLAAGKEVPLRFLVPSRLASYGFKVKKLRGETLYGEPVSTFRLALTGLLGWFADAIDVSYRDRDRQLIRFEGLSNIRATPDENLVARIDFPPDQQGEAATAEAWDAAEQEPLKACEVGG